MTQRGSPPVMRNNIGNDYYPAVGSIPRVPTNTGSSFSGVPNYTQYGGYNQPQSATSAGVYSMTNMNNPPLTNTNPSTNLAFGNVPQAVPQAVPQENSLLNTEAKIVDQKVTKTPFEVKVEPVTLNKWTVFWMVLIAIVVTAAIVFIIVWFSTGSNKKKTGSPCSGTEDCKKGDICAQNVCLTRLTYSCDNDEDCISGRCDNGVCMINREIEDRKVSTRNRNTRTTQNKVHYSKNETNENTNIVSNNKEYHTPAVVRAPARVPPKSPARVATTAPARVPPKSPAHVPPKSPARDIKKVNFDMKNISSKTLMDEINKRNDEIIKSKNIKPKENSVVNLDDISNQLKVNKNIKTVIATIDKSKTEQDFERKPKVNNIPMSQTKKTPEKTSLEVKSKNYDQNVLQFIDNSVDDVIDSVMNSYTRSFTEDEYTNSPRDKNKTVIKYTLALVKGTKAEFILPELEDSIIDATEYGKNIIALTENGKLIEILPNKNIKAIGSNKHIDSIINFDKDVYATSNGIAYILSSVEKDMANWYHVPWAPSNITHWSTTLDNKNIWIQDASKGFMYDKMGNVVRQETCKSFRTYGESANTFVDIDKRKGVGTLNNGTVLRDIFSCCFSKDGLIGITSKQHSEGVLYSKYLHGDLYYIMGEVH